jgi:alkylhydroperoxidase family enzyme
MPRLPKATRESFPEDLKYVWDRLAGDTTAPGNAGPANIFLALGNNPRVLLGYLRLANPLWAHCGLDERAREIAILRAAYVQNSAYEWHQHVRIGKTAGLSDQEIDAIRDYRESDRFTPAEKAMLGWVDALAVSDHPGKAAFDELSKHFPESTVVGITILAAFYFATAKFLASMEVETEDAFTGWAQ